MPGPRDQERIAAVVACQAVVAEGRVGRQRLDTAELGAVLEDDIARFRQPLSRARDDDPAVVRRRLVRTEPHRREHRLANVRCDRAAPAIGVDVRVRDEVRGGGHPSVMRRTRGSRRRQTTERSPTR